MSNVAFRLFKVDLHKNNAKLPLSSGIIPGIGTMESLVIQEMNKLKNQILRQLPKVNLAPADLLTLPVPKSGDPCFVINDFRNIFPDVIEVEIYKGEYGDLDFLVGKNGSLTNISNDAATRRYLVRIAFPKNMNTCYLVAQMRGRSQGGTDLCSQLSFDLHKSASKLVNNNLLQQIGDWYRFVFEPIADSQRFNAALSSASVETFKLVKEGVGSNGSKTQEKYSVEYSKPSLNAKQTGLSILRLLSSFAGHSVAYKPAINKIATVFPNWANATATNWDDGLITFVENQKRTTISANAIAELFVYPLGDKATMKDLWSEANSRLAIIGKTDSIAIPSIV